ncbi:MAG: hypothetical protein K0R53_1237, partial [Burkholderiales bacterium]|nr:hypothetical protein [Burkholderiales bacterium]
MIGFGHHQRRHDPHHLVGGHVDDQAGVEPRFDQLAARLIQLHADHHPHTAYFHYARRSAEPRAQAFHDGAADARGVVQQAFLAHRIQRRDHRGHRQRVAAESGAVIAGLEHAFRAAAGHACAHGHAGAQALGERHDVGKKARVLVHEPLAGAPEAALHFIGNEQPSLTVADILEPAQVLHAGDVDAAFALYRLDHHGADVPVVLRHLAYR